MNRERGAADRVILGAVVSGGISVVIPALDEEACVADAVASVRDRAEVLVVDGGSRDGTSRIARAAGARVLQTNPGRGRQLHLGARAAGGDWLVFLHADTRLEAGWAEALLNLPPDVVGGAFRLAIASPRRAFRLVEAGVALRCRLLSLPYGDQAIFVRRDAYEIVGGFAPIPLMEDVHFIRRLARHGRLAFLPVPAVTSPRRWERHGLLGATLRNWWVMGLYVAGCSPARLARLYEGQRPRVTAIPVASPRVPDQT
jgi:hypothetical protein